MSEEYLEEELRRLKNRLREVQREYDSAMKGSNLFDYYSASHISRPFERKISSLKRSIKEIEKALAQDDIDYSKRSNPPKSGTGAVLLAGLIGVAIGSSMNK